MKYKVYSYNQADSILEGDLTLNSVYYDLVKIIESISDDDIIDRFKKIGKNSKSISNTISNLLDEKLMKDNWIKEIPFFDDTLRTSGRSKRWTLDYYKEKVQLEIAFNHEEGTAWNLMKIPLAIKPNIYTHNQRVDIGIIVTATNQMKKAGGFDNSVGSFEKYIEYLKIFTPFISNPILLIGLQSPDDFKVRHRNIDKKKIGQIREV